MGSAAAGAYLMLVLFGQQRIVPISVEDLSRKAEVVGVATVQSVRAREDRENGMIYTEAVLRFSEVWKGPRVEEFVLSQAGGAVGNQAVVAVGFNYRLGVGEEIVVFAVPSRGNSFTLVGMTQGLFRVGASPDKPLTRESERGRPKEGGPLRLADLRSQVSRAIGSAAPPAEPRENPAARTTGEATRTSSPEARTPTPPPHSPVEEPRRSSGAAGIALGFVAVVVIATLIGVLSARKGKA